MNTIQKVGKEKISEIVKQSTSIAEVFREIGLSISSDAYKLFRKEMKNMNIDISHFVSKGIVKRNNIKEEFVINSNAPNASIKNYILKNDLIEYKCNLCNLEPKWNNKTLILQLDHINGINNDNRLENLRFLCPNCHSQTHTFAGKNKELKNTIELSSITKEELESLVNTKKLPELCKLFNVTNSILRLRLKELNLCLPKHGYWSKLERKISVSDTLNVISLYKEKNSFRKISKILNIPRSAITKIVNEHTMSKS